MYIVFLSRNFIIHVIINNSINVEIILISVVLEFTNVFLINTKNVIVNIIKINNMLCIIFISFVMTMLYYLDK